jgi:hypothetical protein
LRHTHPAPRRCGHRLSTGRGESTGHPGGPFKQESRPGSRDPPGNGRALPDRSHDHAPNTRPPIPQTAQPADSSRGQPLE